MTVKNINQLTKEYKNKIFNFDASKDLIEIYYNEKENNPIPLDNVHWIKIKENMFSLLPTLELNLEDSGYLFTTYNIKQGGLIYLTITPNYEENIGKGKENYRYVDSVFVIQSIITRVIPGKPNYTHIIKCTYNAQNYLNQYVSYPPNEGLKNIIENLIYLPKKELSSDVIKNVLQKSTLKYVDDFDETSLHDTSVWINSNQSRAKFIDKVVSHAWTEKGDSPLLFTDRNGFCHYTSLNNLVKKEIKLNVYNAKMFDTFSEKNTNKKHLITNEFLFINSNGTNLNENGYDLKQYVFDPIPFDHIKLTNIFDNQIKVNTKIYSDNSKTKDIANSLGIHDTNNTVSKLASQINKTSTQINNLSLKCDSGMHFNHTHDYYDIAPKHNENVRKSFFNIFVKFDVDSRFFDDEFNNKKLRPELGDIIFLDFSYSKNAADKLHTGKYMVVGINNVWIKNGSYTLSYQCVSDGYFGDVKKEEL